MPTLEPTVALVTLETALRELMSYAYRQKHGPNWLEAVTTEKQRSAWADRAQTEQARTRRGVAEVDDLGLTYSNLYDLLTIAGKNWNELAPALDDKATTYALLKRFDFLRNPTAHSRVLVGFEQDLLSGVAGLIRNQVTLFMSSQDEAGQYYPRIESAIDSFGHRIEGEGPPIKEMFGRRVTGTVLHPGDRVQFVMTGTDPQDRPLQWVLTARSGSIADSAVSNSGEPVTLEWIVDNGDVSESTAAHIHMETKESPFHRCGRFDHRAYFQYIVRPPRGPSPVG